jgi:predicted AAA+ superfamily ATPase
VLLDGGYEGRHKGFSGKTSGEFSGEVAQTAGRHYEVDFVIQIGPRLLPIEVKYRENIESEDFRGLGAFMRTFGAKDGILVTKHDAGQKSLAEGTIYLVPASVFLLSNGDLL